MFGISFTELLIVIIVAFFLVDMHDVAKAIKLCKNFGRTFFEIKDEILEKFSDLRSFCEETGHEEHVIDTDKSLRKVSKPSLPVKARKRQL